jgi:YggT family protein
MFVLANFITATAAVLDIVLTFYLWIVIARALLSWVNADPRNPIVRFLHNATEPVLYPVRRALPYMSGVDLSPLVVCAGIYFLRIFLVGTLYGLAARMG